MYGDYDDKEDNVLNIIVIVPTSASVKGGIIQDALFWSTTVPSASLVLNLDTLVIPLSKRLVVIFGRIFQGDHHSPRVERVCEVK